MSFSIYYYYYFCTKRHHCHYGACPPCHQSCDLTLSCGHVCTARCHDNKPDSTKLTKVCTLSLCLDTFHQALIISQETSGFFHNISVYLRSSNIIFFFSLLSLGGLHHLIRIQKTVLCSQCLALLVLFQLKCKLHSFLVKHCD